MIKGKISPSMMCADFTELKQTLEVFERCGVEYLHLDIMDGHFVPNITLGESLIRQIRKITEIPFDYHLMITDPEMKIDWFDLREGDLMSVHYESTPHVQREIGKIKDKGVKAGLALNPATPLNVLDYLACDIDFLLLMTVNPGFAGQKVVSQTLEKIRDARNYLDGNGNANVMIEVDGCVSYPNAKIMRENGADIFVGGTSSIFAPSTDLEQGLEALRAVIK